MGDACSTCKGTGLVWRGFPPRIPPPRVQGHGAEGRVMAERRRDPEADIPCADCGLEPARLRTETREGVRRLVCDPEYPGTPTPRGDR